VQPHGPAGDVVRVERDGVGHVLHPVRDDRVEQTVLAAEVAVELRLVGVRRRDDAVDPGTGDAALRELPGGRVQDALAGRGAPWRGRKCGHDSTLTNRTVGLFSASDGPTLKQTE